MLSRALIFFQVSRSKDALLALAASEVVLAVMNACGYITRASESGSLVNSDMMRLMDPALKLLERFAWDEAGLEALRR